VRNDTDGTVDRALLRNLADGDASALGQLYDRHAAPLYRYARSLVGQLPDADDLVQDTFLNLATTGSDLLAIRQPRPYLYQILRALWIDRVRRHRSSPQGAVDADSGEPVWISQDQGLSIDLNRGLCSLTVEQREVVELHVVGGFSFREIGAITGTSMWTASSRYRLALGRLRASLG
jgi:RNA polymerase sigma-70 factor (ECF subfamily)